MKKMKTGTTFSDEDDDDVDDDNDDDNNDVLALSAISLDIDIV